jgi:hypothetical protein
MADWDLGLLPLPNMEGKREREPEREKETRKGPKFKVQSMFSTKCILLSHHSKIKNKS